MAADMRTDNPANPPVVPAEVLQLATDANRQFFVVHLIHPPGTPGKDESYYVIGGFLPRVGERFDAENLTQQYKVRQVLHKMSSGELKSGTTVYSITHHVICVPKDAPDPEAT